MTTPILWKHPVRDQAEARNLNHALDFLEELVRSENPIIQNDVRQIHRLVLKGIDESAGSYRTTDVRISGSDFLPPDPIKVPMEMNELSTWLARISEASYESDADPILLAAAAHAWLAQVHPFVDGNGRTARIVMNLMLMRRGYPIAIITKEDRERYYDALEESQSSDLSPLAYLLVESVEESLEEYEVAAKEEQERGSWIADIAGRLAQPERIRLNNEFELFARALALLREHFRSIVSGLVLQSQRLFEVYFKEFGGLDIEKYTTLRNERSAKRTWYFRPDFKRGDRSARYLFFFGYSSPILQGSSPVTLHVAREDPEGSFYYVNVRDLVDVPEIQELGYDTKKDEFVVADRTGRRQVMRAEHVAREFSNEVVARNFAS